VAVVSVAVAAQASRPATAAALAAVAAMAAAGLASRLAAARAKATAARVTVATAHAAATVRVRRVAAAKSGQHSLGRRSRPLNQKKPVLRHRFFFVPTQISRCGKIFCLVKNRVAWHNKAIAAGETAFLNAKQK
jgi:hypothetical protein